MEAAATGTFSLTSISSSNLEKSPKQQGQLNHHSGTTVNGTDAIASNTINTTYSKGPSDFSPIKPHEEKELQRVYALLCNYSKKSELKNEIMYLENWGKNVKLEKEGMQYNDQIDNFESNQNIDQNIEAILQTTEIRLKELKEELLQIGIVNERSLITLSDILEMYQFLGKKISKAEAEEVIWEVDEDLDGCINWSEFRLMFGRNITDTTGLEPSRMYNLAQYLMYDTTGNGRVSVDGTMSMLYARYGRVKMELKLKELFGQDMIETGREGGEITFSTYLAAVEKLQLRAFFGTTKGKIAMQKDTFKIKGINLEPLEE